MKNLRKQTKILLLTNWLVLISAAMIAPIYAIYVEKIWWDLMDASIALWIFALTAGMITLLSWRFTDKIKNKTLIIILWYIVTINHSDQSGIFFVNFLKFLLDFFEKIVILFQYNKSLI